VDRAQQPMPIFSNLDGQILPQIEPNAIETPGNTTRMRTKHYSRPMMTITHSTHNSIEAVSLNIHGVDHRLVAESNISGDRLDSASCAAVEAKGGGRGRKDGDQSEG
jgi:hypothetical protein